MADTVTKTTPIGIGAYLKAIYDNVPQVFAAGSNAWNRDFWNSYQKSGALEDCSELFSGGGWTAKFFTPQYNIHPTQRATNMFAHSRMPINLVTHLENLDVKLITRDATDLSGIYYDTAFTAVPEVVLGSTLDTPVKHLFSESDELVYASIQLTQEFMDTDIPVIWSQCFEKCEALRDLTFSGPGVINYTIDLQWSTRLTKASITNVINYLASDTSDLVCRLSLAAVNIAFETSEGANNGTASEEWLNLIESKPNWSFGLIEEAENNE